MIKSLQALADNRQSLLLAEVGALIHNIGKLGEEFLRYQAGESGYEKYDYQAIVGIVADLVSNLTLTKQQGERLQSAINANQEPKTSGLLSAEQKGWLRERTLNLPNPLDDHSYALGDFIEFQDFGWYKTTRGGSPPRITLLFSSGSRATELLEASHNAAPAVEKEGVQDGKQTNFPLHIATAFGLEVPMEMDKFKAWRDELLNKLPTDGRHSLSLAHLEKAVGDTRRPINEVRLSDLSFSVAGFFKSALAQAIIRGKWTSRNDLRWRLLRVNFDVLRLYAKAVKIADLMGYQEVVKEACAAVKQLVEEEYPLGNEIYRDTTGIYFTFPDIDLPADLAQEIRHRVEEVEHELAPYIAVEKPSGSIATDQLKHMLAEGRGKALKDLAQPFSQDNLSPCWQALWDNLPKDGKWELCPVCRLRPMKEGAEACGHCLGRRSSRIQAWLRNPHQTIWMDEIADHNDRVALLVGKFGLEDWLSGDLVQTMLVRAVENKPNECQPKNPSPARLRRVWETCQRFWEETVNGILQGYTYGTYGKGSALRCVRVAVVPDDTSGWKENIPYDGTINGKAVSLLWQEDKKRFITIINLQLSASQAQDEAALVGEWQNQACTVDLPDRPGKQRTFKVQQVMLLSGDPLHTYIPYLTLLESPDQFLALIPASEALEFARQIEQEYRKQMGKVQNRLPLFLGLVFFQRKTPLMAVMDTARRMVEQVNLGEEEWKVECVRPSEDGQTLYLRFSNGPQRLEFNVPLKMGDKQAEDIWYPYFFVNAFFDHTPDNRVRRFRLKEAGDSDSRKVSEVSEKYADRWLVHAKDLKPGDVVTPTPSRFAYLFLESTAQRFRFDPQREVLLLDDLQRLRELWKTICKSPEMTDSKLQAIAAFFKRKRQEWDLPCPTPQAPISDEAFCHLVETTLKRDKVQINPDEVLNGHFQRTVDLHRHILKYHVEDFRQKGGSK